MSKHKRLIALSSGALWIALCATGYALQRPATVAVATAPKCPDLSGKYMIQGDDGQVNISIKSRTV
jgi:hypothetical protein